jgi:hypothetical protein
LNNLDQISDWIAICNAKARYCRTLDTKDWDGFRDMFTEDYELDVSDGTGMPVIKGRDAAMTQVMGSILTAKTAHQVHTPEITLNGDEAHAIFAMQDRVVWGPDRALTGSPACIWTSSPCRRPEGAPRRQDLIRAPP